MPAAGIGPRLPKATRWPTHWSPRQEGSTSPHFRAPKYRGPGRERVLQVSRYVRSTPDVMSPDLGPRRGEKLPLCHLGRETMHL